MGYVYRIVQYKRLLGIRADNGGRIHMGMLIQRRRIQLRPQNKYVTQQGMGICVPMASIRGFPETAIS